MPGFHPLALSRGNLLMTLPSDAGSPMDGFGGMAHPMSSVSKLTYSSVSPESASCRKARERVADLELGRGLEKSMAPWSGLPMATRCVDASRWWRERHVARDGASPRRSAKPARPWSAPDAQPRRSGPSTTGPRPSRRPPSWSRGSAAPASPMRSTTSTPRRCERSPTDPRRARPHRRARQRHLGRRDAEGRPAAVEHADLGARPRHRPAHPAAGDRHAPHHVAPPAAAARSTAGRPAGRGHRRHHRLQRRRLPHLGLLRPGQGRGEPARVLAGPRAGTASARPRSRSRPAGCARR